MCVSLGVCPSGLKLCNFCLQAFLAYFIVPSEPKILTFGFCLCEELNDSQCLSVCVYVRHVFV